MDDVQSLAVADALKIAQEFFARQGRLQRDQTIDAKHAIIKVRLASAVDETTFLVQL
jgi:hypothetical protein